MDLRFITGFKRRGDWISMTEFIKMLKALVLALVFGLLLVSMVPAGVASEGSPVVWTDKADYSPGEIVTIYGSGFQANSTVSLTVVRPDGSINDPEHGIVGEWSVTADGSGSFQTTYQLDGIEGTYSVTATDGVNTAITTFTDKKEDIRNFTATISPNNAMTGESKSYTITITNDTNSDKDLGSAVVTIPSGFTSVSITNIVPPSGKTWKASLVSGQIKLTADKPNDKLGPGQNVSVTFSATAPATAGTYTWNTTAYEGEDWKGQQFTTGTQPTVTVSSPTVSITITSSPSGSGFVKVDSTAITTPQTFTWTVGSTHTLEAISPVSGGTGTQYVWANWSDGGNQTNQYTVPSSNQTVTAYYKTQYLVTYAATGNALPVTVPDNEWVNSGSAATGVFPDNVTDTGVRCNFTGDNRPATITAPTTITGTYQTQYLLNVVSPYGTTGGEGWYDEGDTAYAAVTPLIVDEDGTLHIFENWSGDASGLSSPSDPISMDAPKTATANWRTIDNDGSLLRWDNYTITSAPAGTQVTLTFDNMYVENITFGAKDNVENAQVIVRDLGENMPSSVSIGPPNNPYGYLTITVVNLDQSKIENIVLTFKVAKSWISANSIDESAITLNRWNENDNTWTSYPAVKVGEDNDYSYFAVSLPGFSIFSISGALIPPPPVTPIVTTRPPSYTPPPPAAAFMISSMTITPRQAAPGDLITITFEVMNFGQVEGSGTVELLIDGVSAGTWDVTLGPGETRTITHTLTAGAVKTYDVTVTGGSFLVRDGFSVRVPSAVAAAVDTVALGGTVVIVIGLLSLLFVILRRR